jgi:membrane protein DedA with SNARE-associated domain
MEQNLIDFTKDIAMQYPYLAYIFFFISASLQILFPPYPGDTVLVLEGYLSSTGGSSAKSSGLSTLPPQKTCRRQPSSATLMT